VPCVGAELIRAPPGVAVHVSDPTWATIPAARSSGLRSSATPITTRPRTACVSRPCSSGSSGA